MFDLIYLLAHHFLSITKTIFLRKKPKKNLRISNAYFTPTVHTVSIHLKIVQMYGSS